MPAYARHTHYTKRGAIMFNKIFSGLDQLKSGLDAATLRHRIISHNIANADTPNYKSYKVEFGALLDGACFSNKKTRDKHISFEADAEAVIKRNDSTTMRLDGNNVDIEYENNELAKNTIYYQTLIEKLNSEITRLKMAINEGR